MKAWLTIEPNKEEVDALLDPEEEGDVKTPLEAVIDYGYLLMTLGHEVSLKITNMRREG